MEVFGKAGLLPNFGSVFEHQAGHLVVLGQDLIVCQRQHRLAAAFAGLDLELALGTGANDEILQQAACCNAGLELGVRRWIGMAPDIAGGLNELVQRDRLDHGTYS